VIRSRGMDTPKWFPAEPAALLGILLTALVLARACVDALPPAPSEARANSRLQDAPGPGPVR
jgi:hypothetical protein